MFSPDLTIQMYGVIFLVCYLLLVHKNIWRLKWNKMKIMILNWCTSRYPKIQVWVKSFSPTFNNKEWMDRPAAQRVHIMYLDTKYKATHAMYKKHITSATCFPHAIMGKCWRLSLLLFECKHTWNSSFPFSLHALYIKSKNIFHDYSLSLTSWTTV